MHLNCAIICLFILLSTFHGVEGRRRQKNYGGILSSLKFKDKLVFDVIKPFNQKLTSEPSQFLNMESFEEIGVRLSPVLYFIPEYKHHPYVDRDGFERAVTGRVSTKRLVKFLFRSELTDNQRVNSSIPLSPHTISSFLSHNGALNDEDFTVIEPVIEHNVDVPFKGLKALAGKNFTELKTLLKDIKSMRPDVKTGLEFIGEIAKDEAYPPLLGLADVVILDVAMSLEGFFSLSYSSFKNKLREVIDQKYEVIQIESSNCKVYIKLNLLFPEGDEELRQKYYYYILQFVVVWVNEEKNEAIILETFNNSMSGKGVLDGLGLEKLLAIPIKSDLKYEVCQFKAMMDHVSPWCGSVTLEKDGLLERIQKDKCILMGDNGCSSKTESDLCNRPNSNITMPDINLRFYIDDYNDKVPDQLSVINRLMSGLPWKLFEVYLSADFAYDRKFLDKFATAISLELPSNISVACGMLDNALNDENIIETTFANCGFLWNHFVVFVWTVDFPDEVQTQDLIRRMIYLEGKRQQFLIKYPGKWIKLRVFLVNYAQLDASSCNPELEAMNEKAETVMNFARIHNTPIEITYYANLEGWRTAKTVRELDRQKLRFPVYVHRDYPEKYLLGEFPTDPCFSWTDLFPKEGILLEPNYGGTTLYMAELKNESLTPEELEMVLMFTLHKFSLVELVPGSLSDIETISEALSLPRLAVLFAARESTMPIKLYLKIGSSFNFTEWDLRAVLGKLSKLELNIMTGIHFDNWNDSFLTLPQNTLAMNEMKLNKSNNNMMVGISLEDCVAEVNNYFQGLHAFPNFHRMDYLICNLEHPIQASNTERKKVANYLDTTLYIRKYFERMFPNETEKELIFRLNPVPSHSQPTEFNVRVDGKFERVVRNQVSDFLTFFSDVGRYASNYKMKFFMFPTFDGWNGSRYGWWRLVDYDGRRSLNNASVFVEKKAEYLGKDTWQPTEDDPEIVYGPNVVGIILGVISLILSGLAVLLLRLWYKRRFVLLSKKEVDTFLYGGAAKDGSSFDDQKFPKQFVISRKRFLLCNIIGKGNFGVVYNATLTDEDGLGSTSVAVKIPPPDCSRESIKSMLSELKVLCYVGEHPHVLQFVGAYVKEIGRGIAYIATELCENGALQEYLRSISSKLTDRQEILEEGIELRELTPNFYQLCRFSFEIAQGMEYMASKKIVHGDLSTRNVLLSSNMECKIGDFGLSRKLYEYKEYIKSKDGPLALPWRWLAIESLKELKFTTQSDVWSYGITLWEIFSLGDVPYPGLLYNSGFVEDLENGVRMSAPKYSRDEIYEEMRRCWEITPEDRPTFAELSQRFCSIRSTEYVQLEGV